MRCRVKGALAVHPTHRPNDCTSCEWASNELWKLQTHKYACRRPEKIYVPHNGSRDLGQWAKPIKLYCQAEQSELIGRQDDRCQDGFIHHSPQVRGLVSKGSHCHCILFYIWELSNQWRQVLKMKDMLSKPLSCFNVTGDQWARKTWTFSIMMTGGEGGWWVTGQSHWSPWGSIWGTEAWSHTIPAGQIHVRSLFIDSICFCCILLWHREGNGITSVYHKLNI